MPQGSYRSTVRARNAHHALDTEPNNERNIVALLLEHVAVRVDHKSQKRMLIAVCAAPSTASNPLYPHKINISISLGNPCMNPGCPLVTTSRTGTISLKKQKLIRRHQRLIRPRVGQPTARYAYTHKLWMNATLYCTLELICRTPQMTSHPTTPPCPLEPKQNQYVQCPTSWYGGCFVC